MEITFKSICEKLGFNPLVNPPKIELSGYEDDSKESHYDKLSFDELRFLCKYMEKHYESKNSEGKT